MQNMEELNIDKLFENAGIYADEEKYVIKIKNARSGVSYNSLRTIKTLTFYVMNRRFTYKSHFGGVFTH